MYQVRRQDKEGETAVSRGEVARGKLGEDVSGNQGVLLLGGRDGASQLPPQTRRAERHALSQ